MRPPIIPNEPPSEPPYLNSTASWYSGDAWFLFEEIHQRCGLPTATHIFQKCIDVAAQQEEENAAIERRKRVRKERAPFKLPTISQIDSADRRQICLWWARLRGTDQRFSASEKKIIRRLAERYQEVDGYPKDFDETALPPTKKKGARKRNAPNAQLPAMFDANNPDSPFSIEKARRGGKMTEREFAEVLVASNGPYGKSVDGLIANLRYHRQTKI
jgi:hypothetical protein